MNALAKVFTFFPTMNAYLKGLNRFNSGDFRGAISNLDKCLKHPKFNNELVYSHYGQALCALGQYEHSYIFLLKACDLYETCGWKFNDEHTLKLAQGTLSALRYISENTDIKVRSDFLEKSLK